MVEQGCAGGGAIAYAWIGGEYDQGPGSGQNVAGGGADDRVARAAVDFTKVASRSGVERGGVTAARLGVKEREGGRRRGAAMGGF